MNSETLIITVIFCIITSVTTYLGTVILQSHSIDYLKDSIERAELACQTITGTPAKKFSMSIITCESGYHFSAITAYKLANKSENQ